MSEKIDLSYEIVRFNEIFKKNFRPPHFFSFIRELCLKMNFHKNPFSQKVGIVLFRSSTETESKVNKSRALRA